MENGEEEDDDDDGVVEEEGESYRNFINVNIKIMKSMMKTKKKILHISNISTLETMMVLIDQMMAVTGVLIL